MPSSTLALGAIALAATLGATGPTGMTPDGPVTFAETIQMSINGSDYVTETTASVLLSPAGHDSGDVDAPFVIVPGDSMTGLLSVRNGGPIATLTVALENVMVTTPDGVAVADEAFLSDLTIAGKPAAELADGEALQTIELEKGSATEVLLDFDFPESATSGNASGGHGSTEYAEGIRSVHVDLRLTLEGDGRGLNTLDLTDSDLAWLPFAAGALLIALGAAALIPRRKEATR